MSQPSMNPSDTPYYHCESEYLVPFDDGFALSQAPTRRPAQSVSKQKRIDNLARNVLEISDLQEVLYSHNRYSLLVVFQAMDAAGKDSTIRAVFSGVNPAGCRVTSFKRPSMRELDHDFLWRGYQVLPARGMIGVFNRSYYEEVLIARVHPKVIEGQNLPEAVQHDQFWEHRLQSIREHEWHLASNGTVVLKFFLNVSKEKQSERFLARLENPDKHWKYNPNDLEEQAHWDAYQEAYQKALSSTSRPWAPWYAIPADSKSYMRMIVSEIVLETLRKLPIHFPKASEEDKALFGDHRERLKKYLQSV